MITVIKDNTANTYYTICKKCGTRVRKSSSAIKYDGNRNFYGATQYQRSIFRCENVIVCHDKINFNSNMWNVGYQTICNNSRVTSSMLSYACNTSRTSTATMLAIHVYLVDVCFMPRYALYTAKIMQNSVLCGF